MKQPQIYTLYMRNHKPSLIFGLLTLFVGLFIVGASIRILAENK